MAASPVQHVQVVVDLQDLERWLRRLLRGRAAE
jgi:hypothetical protein